MKESLHPGEATSGAKCQDSAATPDAVPPRSNSRDPGWKLHRTPWVIALLALAGGARAFAPSDAIRG